MTENDLERSIRIARAAVAAVCMAGLFGAAIIALAQHGIWQ
jgi:hypothetical protein